MARIRQIQTGRRGRHPASVVSHAAPARAHPRRSRQIGSIPYTLWCASTSETITSLGGRAPPSQNMRMPYAGFRWPGATRGSPAPAPSSSQRRRSAPRHAYSCRPRLLYPLVQRLARAPDLRHDRHHRRPPAYLWRKLVGRLACHRPFLSGVVASDKPGAVQPPGIRQLVNFKDRCLGTVLIRFSRALPPPVARSRKCQ